jgi:hypothetical protein
MSLPFARGTTKRVKFQHGPVTFLLFLFYVAAVTGAKRKLAAMAEIMGYGSENITSMTDNPDPNSSVT